MKQTVPTLQESNLLRVRETNESKLLKFITKSSATKILTECLQRKESPILPEVFRKRFPEEMKYELGLKKRLLGVY